MLQVNGQPQLSHFHRWMVLRAKQNEYSQLMFYWEAGEIYDLLFFFFTLCCCCSSLLLLLLVPCTFAEEKETTFVRLIVRSLKGILCLMWKHSDINFFLTMWFGFMRSAKSLGNWKSWPHSEKTFVSITKEAKNQPITLNKYVTITYKVQPGSCM